MGAARKLLMVGAAAPALIGMKAGLAMNREDYMHSRTALKHRKKDGPDEAKIADLVKAVKDTQEQFRTRDAEVVAAVKKANEEAAAAGKASIETMAKLNDAIAKASELGQRLLDLEQKMGAVNDNAQHRAKQGRSFSDFVLKDEGVAAWLKNPAAKSVRMQLKAITSNTTGAGGAGDLIRPDRVAEIIRPQDRLLTIRDLISIGRTSSDSIEYVQETGFTNAAAPVAETAQKPESSIAFTLKTTPVRTIAHWVQASRQVLADAGQLQSYLDNRLRYGLKIVEENQILAGDGTGQNLLGLIPEASTYNRPLSETKIDVIRRAMTQVRLSEYRADGVVLNPADWEDIELTKTTTGEYVWANPHGLLAPTIWGMPVVDTTAMEADNFLVGAFRLAAILWDREDASVEISREDRDNFIKNMVTILAEERLALAVWRPEALVTGDFAGNISG